VVSTDDDSIHKGVGVLRAYLSLRRATSPEET